MKQSPKSLLAILAVLVAVAGCSSGDGPSPPGNDNAVADAMKTMSREEKIKFYQNSPLPPDQKAAKLKELGVEPGASSPSGAPTGQ